MKTSLPISTAGSASFIGSGLLLAGAVGCSGPVGLPMAPISPAALELPPVPGAPAKSPRPNRIMVQSSGGMELSPGGIYEDGSKAQAHRRALYSLDVRYLRTIEDSKWDLGMVVSSTNFGLRDFDFAYGASFRGRFEVTPKLTIAPSVGGGAYGVDANTGFARKMRKPLWWYSVVGIRIALRGFHTYGASGFYYQLRSGFGLQFMLGLQYHLVVDALDRLDVLSEPGEGPSKYQQTRRRVDYDFRLFSPHISIGPVFGF